MFLVLRVGEAREEILVAARTAHVLGRAGTRAVRAIDRRLRCVARQEQILDRDDAVPVVAEVVQVVEAAAAGPERLVEWLFVRPIAAWMTRSSLGSVIPAGTTMRRHTRGVTSSRSMRSCQCSTGLSFVVV